jgi:hypothetical protein
MAMADELDDYRVDRSVFTVASLTDASDERAYWHAQTPAERLRALELMRQVMYGVDSSTGRLQRVLEVAQLKKG